MRARGAGGRRKLGSVRWWSWERAGAHARGPGRALRGAPGTGPPRRSAGAFGPQRGLSAPTATAIPAKDCSAPPGSTSFSAHLSGPASPCGAAAGAGAATAGSGRALGPGNGTIPGAQGSSPACGTAAGAEPGAGVRPSGDRGRWDAIVGSWGSPPTPTQGRAGGPRWTGKTSPCLLQLSLIPHEAAVTSHGGGFRPGEGCFCAAYRLCALPQISPDSRKATWKQSFFPDRSALSVSSGPC